MSKRSFAMIWLPCMLACYVFLSTVALPQGGVEVRGEAPPPLKYIPQEERSRLSAERDTKSRTRLSLELINERLESAERHTRAERYGAASAELGIYQALIEEAVAFLKAKGRTDNKTRDLFKLVEMTLRAHGSRIEAMRRLTPSSDAVNVQAAYEYVQLARTEALNAFFDDQVLTGAPTAVKKNAREQDVKDSFSRLDAIYALLADKSRAGEAIPELIDLLKEPDVYVRLGAAYALGYIGPQARAAVPRLLELLKDQEAMMRINAAYALGLIGADADVVVPELVKLIKDRNRYVRFNAAEAIGRFGRNAVPALTGADHQK